MSQINLITWTKTNKMKDVMVYDGHMFQFIKKNVTDDHYKCCFISVKFTKFVQRQNSYY